MPPAAAPAINQSGQAMRRKGQEKRQRLIDATVTLLGSRPLAQLRPADIAREAGSSLPNFYLYFADVLEALLAAVQQLPGSDPRLLALFDADWPADEIDARAREFVLGYVEYWRMHAPLLRARSMCVAEGDARFIAVEQAGSLPLLLAMTAQLARARPDLPHPAATAGMLIAMVDRYAGWLPYGTVNEYGITAERLTDAAAAIIAHTLRG